MVQKTSDQHGIGTTKLNFATTSGVIKRAQWSAVGLASRVSDAKQTERERCERTDVLADNCLHPNFRLLSSNANQAVIRLPK